MLRFAKGSSDPKLEKTITSSTEIIQRSSTVNGSSELKVGIQFPYRCQDSESCLAVRINQAKKMGTGST
jgi:hypothetical protein